jgi:hypothetical protein
MLMVFSAAGPSMVGLWVPALRVKKRLSLRSDRENTPKCMMIGIYASQSYFLTCF